jgi:hypothetical protein
MRPAGDETRTHGRRRTEQVEQDERVTAEVADQREVVAAGQTRHRPVVMDARNRLHAPPVAVAQAHAIDALRAPDVRAAVACDRDRLVGRQAAGHAGDPEHLVADRAIDELVDLRQLGQARFDAGVHAGDELELRFAEIGGDVRMGQRRPQTCRVRRQGQRAVGLRTQAFLLDAAPHAGQALGRQCLQALLDVACVMCHQVPAKFERGPS